MLDDPLRFFAQDDFRRGGLLRDQYQAAGVFDPVAQHAQFGSRRIFMDEIRSLLSFRDAPNEGCHAVNELLERHIGHVAHRISELQALKTQLQALRSQCRSAEAAQNCEILQSLAGADSTGPVKLETHGRGCS